MRTFVLCFVVGLLTLVSCNRNNKSPEPSLEVSIKLQEQEVKAKTNRVLDFTADWCPPCQDMERFVWSRRSVKDALKWYKGEDREKIDLSDQEPEAIAIADKYNVVGIPTIIILDVDGNVVYKQSKYHSEAELVKVLKKYR